MARELVKQLLARVGKDTQGELHFLPGTEDELHRALVQAEKGPRLRETVYDLLRMIVVFETEYHAEGPGLLIRSVLATRPACLGAIPDEERDLKRLGGEQIRRAPQHGERSPGEPLSRMLPPGDLERRRAQRASARAKRRR